MTKLTGKPAQFTVSVNDWDNLDFSVKATTVNNVPNAYDHPETAEKAVGTSLMRAQKRSVTGSVVKVAILDNNLNHIHVLYETDEFMRFKQRRCT